MPFEAILFAKTHKINIMATSSDIERELLRSDSEPSGWAGGSSGIGSLDRDSQQHMLQSFAKLLDAKLEQKFTTFKRSFEEKEEQHATEIKKIKSEAKASSSFKYKGNRIQYEFSTSIFDRVESCSTQLLAGNLSKVNNELEQIKVLINKHNKLICFADKSPAGWSAVDEYESDELAENSDDEKKLRSAERRAMSKMKFKSKPKSTAAVSFRQNKADQESGDLNPPQQNFRPYNRSFRTYGQFPADKCFSCLNATVWPLGRFYKVS